MIEALGIPPKILVVGLFALAYLLIIVFYHHKMYVVWAAALLLVVAGLLGVGEALRAIEWNVVLLYFGMLLVSEVFLYSRMPDYLATLLAGRARRTGTAMVLLCLFTGFLSIALENVAVVLLVAPIAMSISRRCDIDPVPLFIGMAVSSNLQGAATLIGDPPSMLLAGFASLSFNDFIVYGGRPGIFFATQVGAAVSAVVLFLLFRRYNRAMPVLEGRRYLSPVPTYLVGALVVALVFGSSFSHRLPIVTGLLCAVFGLLSLIWYLGHSKARETREFFSRLDWQTGVFLMGIFVLVESLSAGGLMEDLADWILRVSGNSPFRVYLIVVWVSVLVSGFVDNVPFLMAMLPVIQLITTRLGVAPYLFYVGLLLGASVGGNLTPVGASANVVAMGILKKHGHRAGFFDFVKIGLPFTVFSVLASTFFAWLIYA